MLFISCCETSDKRKKQTIIATNPNSASKEWVTCLVSWSSYVLVPKESLEQKSHIAVLILVIHQQRANKMC